MKTEHSYKIFSIQNFAFTVAFFAAASATSKGLKYFKASMGSVKSAGTNDDVSLKLFRGVNGQSCKTGVLWEGGIHDSWSSGDVEEYKSSNQDFGDCGAFEADRKSIGFTIHKYGEDGLTLVKMEFHIGDETYIWTGKAKWDPTHAILTATCSKGNCQPIDCTFSEWTTCKDCSADCKCKTTRKIRKNENFGGKCPERETLDKIIDCKNNSTCPSIPGKEKSLSAGWIIGLSLLGAFGFFQVCCILHAIHTCRRYKSIQRDQNINIRMKTVEDPGCCCWCLLHTKKYTSGKMLYEIRDHLEMQNATVEQNPDYGVEEPEYEDELVDYNEYYGQAE